MNIDPETGLPTLPEGYFWRVRHHREYSDHWGLTAVDRSKLQLQLIHKYVNLREDLTLKRNWWGKTVEVSHIYRDEIEGVVFTENCHGTSPIAILNAANRIVNLWGKSKIRDALVGDYPPKKLGTENS